MSPAALSLQITEETWPIAGTFTISRGSKTEVNPLVVTLSDGTYQGRGECIPYARYGETHTSVAGQIKHLKDALANGLTRSGLQGALPAGAARNALDCAMWDLEAKQQGQPAWQRAGIPALKPVETAYTLSLDTPDNMAKSAAKVANRPLLKIKLGADQVAESLAAIRSAAPNPRLIVDANEAWAGDALEENLALCARYQVDLVEQPLPAGADSMLASLPHPVPVCADESLHTSADLAHLKDRYDAINIKLDKAGGLTEALHLARRGQEQGFIIMVGCMLATSLAMAPAMLVAQSASFVDLDGPLLLARDREPGLRFDDTHIHPPSAALWG